MSDEESERKEWDGTDFLFDQHGYQVCNFIL